MSKFYITTAIDYANGEPHLGHAVEKIGADVIARYRRSIGDDVWFVIGMDEHGQKVQREAESQGRDPQEWVDSIAKSFERAWGRLGISHDDFIRTSQERHRRGVRELMRQIGSAGRFRKARYSGHYCAGCEAFKKPEELEGGRCPLHPTREIEWTEEENWFFELSAYRAELQRRLRDNPDLIRPESRRNEILRLLEQGLEDISASRSRISWGIPFPGDDDHTVYVWFDALANYITAVGYPDGDRLDEWWPADLHVIGKDITRFHCVYWPAMLLAAGVEPPLAVWGHGFINVGGAKLSKSAGTSLDLDELTDRHGAEALRFFLLSEVPWDGDRGFASAEEFISQFDRRYTSDLANDLGNLLNRVVSMAARYRKGIRLGSLCSPGSGGASQGPLSAATAGRLAAYREHMSGLLLHRAIGVAMGLVRDANTFVDSAKPWELAKAERGGADPADLDAVLGQLAEALGTLAAMLTPVMPGKAEQMWSSLGGSAPSPPALSGLASAIGDLGPAEPGPVLFPRDLVGEQ